MEAVSSPNVQLTTVTQPQQITLQGTGPSNAQSIQIFAQDVQDPSGKALYIIDPSQAGGLQMISNADQRFEFSGSTTSPQSLSRSTPQPQQSTVVINGHQVIAQRLPVSMEPLDEPLYVNAKQYHRIIKRRQARAKLEAEGKIPKLRKKYLHESRHLHAVRRNRSMGGRFIGRKNGKGEVMEEEIEEGDTVTPRISETSHEHPPTFAQPHPIQTINVQPSNVNIQPPNINAQSANKQIYQSISPSISAPSLLVSPGQLQHTMIQIQNNMPVMSSSVQNPTSSNLPPSASATQASTVAGNQMVQSITYVASKIEI